MSDFDLMVPAPWDAIEVVMDRKERQRKSFIWFGIAAGALIVLTGSVMAFLHHGKSHQKQGAAHNKATKESIVAQSPVNTTSSSESRNSEELNQNANSANLESEIAADLSESKGSVSVLKPKSYPVNPIQTNTSPVSPDKKQATNKQPELAALPLADVLNSASPILLLSEIQANEIMAKGMLYTAIPPFELGSENMAAAQAKSAEQTQHFTSPAANTNKVLGSWLLEVSADQNQTGMLYKPNQQLGDYVHKNYFKHMKEGEFALGGSRVHVAILKQITPHSYIKAGFAWAQNRTLQNFDFSDSMPAVVSFNQKADVYGNYPIFGYLSPGPQVKFTGKTQYQWLSFPIGWVGNYSLGKHWSLSPEMVIQPNKISLTTPSKTLDYQTLLLKDLDASVFRSWVMGARLAVGVEKRLNYAHAIGMRVNTQGLVQSMNLKNSPVQSRGWSMGMSVYYVVRID